MRTGRPRKPTQLRVIEGNRSHSPLPNGEPRPIDTGKPVQPKWLSPLARQEWKRVVDELWMMGVVAPLDQTTIAAYVECFSRWREAENGIAVMAKNDPLSKGLLVKMPSGAIVQNPLIGIARRARMDMLRFAGELGLSPSSRAYLEGLAKEDGDLLSRKYGIR